METDLLVQPKSLMISELFEHISVYNMYQNLKTREI